MPKAIAWAMLIFWKARSVCAYETTAAPQSQRLSPCCPSGDQSQVCWCLKYLLGSLQASARGSAVQSLLNTLRVSYQSDLLVEDMIPLIVYLPLQRQTSGSSGHFSKRPAVQHAFGAAVVQRLSGLIRTQQCIWLASLIVKLGQPLMLTANDI